MKKYFMFAAVVTAGMLASCSSESLTGSDPKIEQPQEEVPIEINVATPITSAVSGTTRGSGTVGGFTDDADNVWNGQKVNVFMFEKGSLTLSTPTGSGTDYIYNNVELTTPAGATSGIAKQYLTATTIQHKYYPQGRTFDFWGYYKDNAAGGAPDATAPVASELVSGDMEVRVPFTIDGTQDLMVAKTNPTAYNDLSAAQKTAFGDEATYLSKLYSASAARQSVQPNLKFKHLLTRLTFSIQGGNAAACGYPLPSAGNNYTGVFVKSIKVKSQNTGYIVAAYNRADMTGDTRFNDAAKLIKFDDTTTPPATNPDNYVPLTLKGSTDTDADGNLDNLYSFDITNEANTIAALAIGSANWGQIIRPTTADGTVFDKVAVGSALLVQPRDKYDIILELGQYLLNVEDTGNPAASTYTIMSSEIPINEVTTTLTDAKFKPGYSYNINITTWGYEEIQITTTLEKWLDAGEVQVDYE